MRRKAPKITEETRVKLIKSHLGKVLPIEVRKKISDSHKGEKSHFWKGGVSSNKEYRNWQKNQRNRTLRLLRVGSGLHSFEEWELLKIQYGFTCPRCKKKEPDIKLTIDHIIPLCKGGVDLIENIQPLCLKCNMIKHTMVIKY